MALVWPLKDKQRLGRKGQALLGNKTSGARGLFSGPQRAEALELIGLESSRA